MSRTFKDRPYKVKSYQATIVDRVDTWNSYLYLKTTKLKRRKTQDTEDHWMSTPSWWINMFMTKPQRRATKLWEHNFSNQSYMSEDVIDSYDTPNVSRKPHIYYW